jgi:2-hydroxy-6-oxonona-2,4-dienedioate hydrolase
MSFLEVDGIRIRYELLGSGPLLVLTPGGRFSYEFPGVRPLAERLAGRYTVVLWDRPNCGASDIVLSGAAESSRRDGRGRAAAALGRTDRG